MNRRQRLGQHPLVDNTVLQAIVDAADIGCDEVVYEIGTGNGILTAELCRRARKVISCEIDNNIVASNLDRHNNLTLLHGDGFKFDVSFDVFVSNLPYSRSRQAIEWLATRRFDRAILMLQKEFVAKILANRGQNYRAVSALSQNCFDIDIVMQVHKDSFNPRPKVDSLLLKIRPKKQVSDGVVKALKLLFSYRRKKVSSIAKKFKIKYLSGNRIDQLTPEEAIDLASTIEQKESLQTL